MITRIFHRQKFKTVKPHKSPKDTRELNAFLLYNKAPLCFVKGVGGWYKVTRKTEFFYVVRALYHLSFKEWLEIALNENFTPNIRNYD